MKVQTITFQGNETLEGDGLKDAMEQGTKGFLRSGTFKKHPNAKVYRDFRVMLDKMDKEIDAVVAQCVKPEQFRAVYDPMFIKVRDGSAAGSPAGGTAGTSSGRAGGAGVAA